MKHHFISQIRVAQHLAPKNTPAVPLIANRSTLASVWRWNDVSWYSSKSSNGYPPHLLIKMPALSPTMTQGNIGAWKKRIGDPVAPGDVLVEIETDKAQMDFECQEEGYLAKILLPEGTKEAQVGKPLAIVAEEAKDVGAFEKYSFDNAAERVPAAPSAALAKSPSTPASPPNLANPTLPSSSLPPAPTGTNERILASPLAKWTAKAQGIDLATVKGTGPGGRIVKSDVLSTAMESTTAPSPAKQGSTAAYTDLPLSNMRKIIATRLCESKQSIPHYYITVSIDMDTVLAIRKRLNDTANGRFKLSINDFIVKASALALQLVPQVNSAWMDGFIRQYHSSDIAVAVATPTGLITPIIAGAHDKGLLDISNEIRQLAALAKDAKLRPEQFQGGSFTVSNLGMYNVDHFTAIINPPQSCILAVGQTIRKVVASEPTDEAEDKLQPESFKVQSLMNVTLSCDHRVVDGATGARWLQQFKRFLEDPATMLL